MPRNRELTPREAVNLMRLERPNSQLNVTLFEERPTLYDDDRAETALPGSVLNVVASARQARAPLTAVETPRESLAFPVDGIVNGVITLRINVK
jgi:hypothetical protein